eukprot:scaffold58602_cov62-Phaeocystis_antarctica.AAC.2
MPKAFDQTIRTVERCVADAWHLHQCGHDAIAVDLVQSVVVLQSLGCIQPGASVVATPQSEVSLRTKGEIRSGEIMNGRVGNRDIRGAVDDHQGPRGVIGAQLGQGEDPQIVHQGQEARKASDRSD